jgi:hypothetical protein
MLCTWCRIEGEQTTKDKNLRTSWLKLIPYCQVDKISLSYNLVEQYLSPILAKKKQSKKCCKKSHSVRGLESSSPPIIFRTEIP